MLQIQLGNPLELSKSPSIKIYIPPEFQMQSSCSFQGFSPQVSLQLLGITGVVPQCQANLTERSISLTNIASQNMDTQSMQLFKISGAIRNPQSISGSAYQFRIQTFKNQQLVDQAQINNPFTVTPGSIYSAAMVFKPSITSYPNPTVLVRLVNQHSLVSGSLFTINIAVRDQELKLMNGGSNILCSGLLINNQSCLAINTLVQGSQALQITFKAAQNIQALTSIEVSLQNMFETVPRFQGRLAKPVTYQTSISNQIVDFKDTIYPQIDNVSLINSFSALLSSPINLADSSIIMKLNQSLANTQTGDYIRVDIPQLYTNILIQDASKIKCNLPLTCVLVNQSNGQDSQSYFKLSGYTGTNQPNLEIFGLKNPYSTKAVGQFYLSIFDSNDRQIQSSPASFNLSTLQPSVNSYVRLIQSTNQPNTPCNYTITIEKNYAAPLISQNNQSLVAPDQIIPWVKLTLPDCIRIQASKSLQILDLTTVTAGSNIIPYTQYGQFDYVFRLHPGINFYTLLNLINPSEACLYQSQRLSFQFRTFEDDQLQFAIDQKLDGLEPSLSCQLPCSTCQSINTAFCNSCNDPLNMILLQDVGRCLIQSGCPKGYFKKATLTTDQICQKCDQGCSECQDGAGVCNKCDPSLNLVINQTDSKCISTASCKREMSLIVSQTGLCGRCSSDCLECGDNTSGPNSSPSTVSSPLFCTKCSDPLKYLYQGQCLVSQSAVFLLEQARGLSNSTISSIQKDPLKVHAVIETSGPLTVLAHFPVITFLLLPSLIVQKCQQVGRYSLTNRELIMLTLIGLEYLSTWALFAKLCIAIDYTKIQIMNLKDYDDQQPQQLLKPRSTLTITQNQTQLFFTLMLVFVIMFIFVHHAFNEYFYRQLIRIWDENVREEFVEEFSKGKERRCCIEMTKLMRYFNFKEWISLWRNKGGSIPRKQAMLRDHLCILFIATSKRFSILQLSTKYILFLICLAALQFFITTDGLFQEGGGGELQAGSSQKYADFQTDVRRAREYILNQTLEVLLLGLTANMLLQKWLLDGDIVNLSESWEYPDDDQISISDSDQSPRAENPDTLRGQNNQQQNSNQVQGRDSRQNQIGVQHDSVPNDSIIDKSDLEPTKELHQKTRDYTNQNTPSSSPPTGASEDGFLRSSQALKKLDGILQWVYGKHTQIVQQVPSKKQNDICIQNFDGVKTKEHRKTSGSQAKQEKKSIGNNSQKQQSKQIDVLKDLHEYQNEKNISEQMARRKNESEMMEFQGPVLQLDLELNSESVTNRFDAQQQIVREDMEMNKIANDCTTGFISNKNGVRQIINEADNSRTIINEEQSEYSPTQRQEQLLSESRYSQLQGSRISKRKDRYEAERLNHSRICENIGSLTQINRGTPEIISSQDPQLRPLSGHEIEKTEYLGVKTNRLYHEMEQNEEVEGKPTPTPNSENKRQLEDNFGNNEDQMETQRQDFASGQTKRQISAVIPPQLNRLAPISAKDKKTLISSSLFKSINQHKGKKSVLAQSVIVSSKI